VLFSTFSFSLPLSLSRSFHPLSLSLSHTLSLTLSISLSLSLPLSLSLNTGTVWDQVAFSLVSGSLGQTAGRSCPPTATVAPVWMPLCSGFASTQGPLTQGTRPLITAHDS